MVDSGSMVVDDDERTKSFFCDSLVALDITDRAIGAASAEEALLELNGAYFTYLEDPASDAYLTKGRCGW